jgi:hypothetical protein
MTTPIFGFTELTSQQDGKEALVNRIANGLEQALAGVLAVSGDANRTIDTTTPTPAEHRYMVVVWSGATTAARELVVPTTTKLWVVKNATSGGFKITVKTAAGTGVDVPAGEERLLRCDGTNVVAAGDTRAVDIAVAFDGKPGDGQEVVLVFNRTTVLPVSLSGSNFISLVAAAGDSTFTLEKRAVGGALTSIGDVTFQLGNAAGVATFAGAVTFSAGEALVITAPSPQDATLEGVSLNFAGTRS